MRGLILALILTLSGSAALAQDRPMRFWNLTRYTDERLRITGVQAGTYDARLKDVSGRVCIVRGVKVEAGAVFSIEEKELTSCE